VNGKREQLENDFVSPLPNISEKGTVIANYRKWSEI